MYLSQGYIGVSACEQTFLETAEKAKEKKSQPPVSHWNWEDAKHQQLPKPVYCSRQERYLTVHGFSDRLLRHAMAHGDQHG